MLCHASGTTSGTYWYYYWYLLVLHNIAASIVYHIMQSCIPHHIVLLILLYTHSNLLLLMLLLLLLLQLLQTQHTTPQHILLYSCTPIIYIQILLQSYHIHISLGYHVCASSLSSYLFSLPISLLIFLLSHNHACSQLLHSLILVCYSVMSIDAINFT